MSKPSAKRWPKLKEAWDQYGHVIPWDELFDIKSRDACYVCLAWRDGVSRNGEEMVDYADLARPGSEGEWEMQNDGHDPITMKQWRTSRIAWDGCDWLTVPANDND